VSTPVCAAPQCDRPAHDGFICVTCRDVLRRDLDAVPVLCEDLQVTIAKQDRLGDTDGRSTDEHPLPLRLGPMEARRDLTDTLRAWADHVAQRRGIPAPEHDPVKAASFLRCFLGEIQDDQMAGDIADEIGYCVIMAGRTVDKPLQHVYAGPCDECGVDLYAHPRASDVSCRNCARDYNIDTRRKWMLTKAEDQLLTATEMSRALPGLLQQQLTASMIRGLAHRGRLTAHPPLPDRPREPVYRVGDVIELLHEISSREAA